MLLATLTYEVQGNNIYSILPSTNIDVWFILYSNFFRYLLYTGSMGSAAVSLSKLYIGNRVAIAFNRLVMWSFFLVAAVFDLYLTFWCDAVGSNPYRVVSGVNNEGVISDFYVCGTPQECQSRDIGRRPKHHFSDNRAPYINVAVVTTLAFIWLLYFIYLRVYILEVMTCCKPHWTFFTPHPAHLPLEDLELRRIWKRVLISSENRSYVHGGLEGNYCEVFPSIEEFVSALGRTIPWMNAEDELSVLEYVALVVQPNQGVTNVDDVWNSDDFWRMKLPDEPASPEEKEKKKKEEHEKGEEQALCNLNLKLDYDFFQKHFNNMLRCTATWSQARLFRRRIPALRPGIVGGVSAKRRTVQAAVDKLAEMNKTLQARETVEINIESDDVRSRTVSPSSISRKRPPLRSYRRELSGFSA